jgi:hypothetical protein
MSKLTMIDHLGIFVSDPGRSFPFYEKSLEPLGILVRERNPDWGSIILAGERRRPFLFIGPAGGDYHGTEVRMAERRPVHLAFRAPSKEAVDAFYRIGLEHGGSDKALRRIAGAAGTEHFCSIRIGTILKRCTGKGERSIRPPKGGVPT